MSRESKIFSGTRDSVNKRVKEYESFGWELLSINGTDVSMSRETQNSVYTELVKYEFNYEELRQQLKDLPIPKKPAKFGLGMALVLLILFVLPGILYIVIKILQFKKFNDEIELYNSEFDRLQNEIEKVCGESRATFFSRQL